MILWVRTGRLFNEGSWSRSPSVFTPSGGPCSRRGALPSAPAHCGASLVTGCLAMRFFIHLPTPAVSLFGIWNKNNCLMNTGEWA